MAVNLLISADHWTSPVQSIVGATDTLRSNKVHCFSEERPSFPVLSVTGVSAGFLRIAGNLRLAEAPYRRQEYRVASEVPMSYIRMRKQADGSTRYTAVIRIRVGKAIVHQEAKTFAHRSAAQTRP